jgi:histidinol-phosphate/aromatic aminotransferase/cobyric acid decarboxylase-like protein
MLDFAVNVRQGEPPPSLVEKLTSRLRDLARYPGADDVRRATQAVANRHGRRPDEVPEDADLVVLGNPTADADARRLAALRADMVAGFRAAGVDVVDGRAPYLLFRVPDADLVRKHLDTKGIAVRRCDTFVGLDGQYLRAAVRQEWPALLEAIDEAIR